MRTFSNLGVEKGGEVGAFKSHGICKCCNVKRLVVVHFHITERAADKQIARTALPAQKNAKQFVQAACAAQFRTRVAFVLHCHNAA